MFTNESEYAVLNRLEARANSGARWFYWIAALSLLTSIVALSGSSWRFLVSLGSTQIVTAIAMGASESLGNAAWVIAIVFDLLATGVFVALGYFASKRQLWAYIAGMVIFGLDALIFFLGPDWIGIIFHCLVVFWIYQGFNSCRKLLALQREAELAPPQPANQNVVPAPEPVLIPKTE